MESWLLYLLARLAFGALRTLPRPTGRNLLDALASLAWILDRRHRHIALVNLRIAFPELSDSKRERIGRRSFQNIARNLLEISRMGLLNGNNIRSLVEYHPDQGFANYLVARSRSRSILYLTGHFSAWELLPAAHALYGHPLSFVTRPLDNPYVEKFLDRRRRTGGNCVISKWRSARQILEALKAGRDVGILVDQNTRVQEGTFADLFGVPAATTTILALLARRADATVLPGFMVPRDRDRYWIKFLPPYDLVRAGNIDDDLQVNTAAMNRILEEFIRAHPDTWLWGHKRWKYQPAGNPPDLYSLSPGELDSFLFRRRRRSI